MADRPDMGTLQVRAMVAHVVPERKRADDDVELKLMGAESPLPDDTRVFLAKRVARSMNDRGHLVEQDPDYEAAIVPASIKGFLNGDMGLVDASHPVTEHLFAVQTGSNNEGVLMMLDCVLDGRDAVAVLKVEHETGVQLEEVQVDGGMALDVTLLENLLLTENTRTFKSGIFYIRDDELVGLVADEQQNDKREIAKFFLRTFLGMTLQQTESVNTERFVKGVVEYVNQSVTDVDQREDIIDDLATEMRAAGPLDPTDFIQRSVPAEHQDGLEAYLVASEVPTQPFHKDLERVKTNQIDKAYWLTENGIKVQGPRNEVKQRVRSIVHEGQAGVFVRGDVKRIG